MQEQEFAEAAIELVPSNGSVLFQPMERGSGIWWGDLPAIIGSTWTSIMTVEGSVQLLWTKLRRGAEATDLGSRDFLRRLVQDDTFDCVSNIPAVINIGDIRKWYHHEATRMGR